MKKYFGYDPHCGFEEFDTEEEAKTYAEQSLDEFRDMANSEGEWDELAENICWGEIKAHCTMKETGQKIEHEGELVDVVDYVLECV